MSIPLLAEARERVLAGWCQGAVARDESGHPVLPSSSDARRWSILGALLASRNGGGVAGVAGAVSSLHSSIDEAALEVWNDRPGRTQQEVVAAFEQALERVEGGGEEEPSGNGDLSAYWLSTCEGFRVDLHDGRVGIVEEVRLSPASRPEALAVRTGLFRTRLLLVPVDDVDEVVPRRKRVLLRSAAA
ncbi:MAG TPA: hypothetical protein VFR63_13345 [Gaiellaceae bacterium]|nr:hypothetical protein [Gaiellaceae bacterium]